MRYLRHILLALPLLAAMLLASCMREPLFSQNPGPGEEQDSEYVTLDLSVRMMVEAGQHVWTKALGETPEVKDLYVAVFDGGDILTEIVKAEPGTAADPRDVFEAGTEANDYLTRFHVTLKRTSEPREIQFIAIGKKDFIDIESFDMVDEASFIKKFIVSDNVDAYWCRKHFTGIDENSAAEMQNLKMIRNFLKVTVSSVVDTDLFELTGFKVFNKPRYGTLAPYNPNTQEYDFDDDGVASVNFNRFADYSNLELNQEDTLNLAYKELVETQKYHGYMPSIVEYISMAEEVGAADPEDWFDTNCIAPGSFDYLYECTYTEAANPFIIFKGRFKGDGAAGHETYYKADFVFHENEDAEKIYFHLLRNFFYELKISSVANDGAETLEAAVNSPSMNNFDGSSEAHTYTVISKTGARMYISSTDILVTDGTQVKVYIKNLVGENYNTTDNSQVSVSKITKCINVKDINRTEQNTSLIRYINPGGYTSDDAAYQAAIGADDFDPEAAAWIGKFAITKTNTNATFNGSSGWVEYTINLSKNPNTLGDNEMWQQEITFSDGDGGLTRTLVLSGRKPYEFSVDVQDYVPGNAGETMTVDIVIPSGISQARFPLRFLIESDDHTIYPDATSSAYPTLPVSSGLSKIPGKSERSYWFTRTITYEEYAAAAEDIQSNKTFTSYFKTLVPASATSVYVLCDSESSNYFDGVENDSFVNERAAGSITFEKNPLTVSVGGKAVNPVTVNSGAPVTYSTNNVAVATVNATTGEVIGVSEGTAIITATIPQYKAYDGATAQFTVTVVKNMPGWTFDWDGLLTPVVNRGQTVSTNTATATVVKGSTTTHPTVTYTSSHTAVATVDASTGVVTGVSSGTVTITAHAEVEADDVYSAVSENISYTIQVVAPGVSLPSSGTEYISVPFTDGSLMWFSKTYTGFDSWYFRSDQLSYGVQASAWDYVGNCSRDSDSWLISPVMDLRAAVNPVLEFNHTGNYWTDGYTDPDSGIMYVPALTEAAGNLAQAKVRMMEDALVLISFDGGTNWSEVGLTAAEYPGGYSWTSQDVAHSLKSLLQDKTEAQLQNVRIAFEYKASPETMPADTTQYRPWAGTWQIKNVQIVERTE